MFKDNKKLVAETMFIKEALKLELSLKEFLLLLYFDNIYDEVFDMKVVAKTLNMKEDDVLLAYGSLMSKRLIKVNAEKDSFGKIRERVSLDNFYNDMRNDYKTTEEKESKADIYQLFEKEFGRTLSNMDYEIINAWIEGGYSEELILAALKEASYNGVTTLRYVDRILNEWNKKGIKVTSDIKKAMESDVDKPLYETSIMNFDWLNEK